LTESFCKKYSFDGIIRSHEAREKGFSEDHSKCWTVFSASHYCNSNNFGAVFEYHIKDIKPRAYSYKTNDLCATVTVGGKAGAATAGGSSNKIIQKNHELIKQFKRLIQANQRKLMGQFKMFDLNKDGTIKTNVWAEILAKHFNNEISTKHLIHIKDLLCECENLLDLVNYKTLFSVSASQDKSHRQQVDQNYMNVVQNLFEILDKNHDKKISSSEVKEALELINKKIGSKYSINEDCVNFIKNMDMNGDNEIDLEEFKKAFFDINSNSNEANGDNVNSNGDEDDQADGFGIERKAADSSDSSGEDDEIMQIVRI
jgi:Ca2+-binding EF-hand superfamily protein